MFHLIKWNTISSLCWDTRNFKYSNINPYLLPKMKLRLQKQLKQLKEFVFSTMDCMHEINYTILNINQINIEKLGIHIMDWNQTLMNKYLNIIHLCPKIETLQITNGYLYNEDVINWIQQILMYMNDCSENLKNKSKFALILGETNDSIPYVNQSLEYALEKHIEIWTKLMSSITQNYCILAQIRHHERTLWLGTPDDNEIMQDHSIMKIYSKKDAEYYVYDDDGKKINKPDDIRTNWLMIISKKMNKGIRIGDFRIENNLDDLLCW